jgi:hypothetical protein
MNLPEYCRKRRKRLKRLGLCGDCGKQKRSKPHIFCEKCLARRRDDFQRYWYTVGKLRKMGIQDAL